MPAPVVVTDGLQLAALEEARLLVRTDVEGVYGRGAVFEQIRAGVDAMITRASASEELEQLRFPPVLPRIQLEANGYLESFPHLAGTVFGFFGDEASAASQADVARRHGDWSGFQSMTDLVLCPAACYPTYPALAERGLLPDGGVTLDTGDAYVFRREPSSDPCRMQAFHMREIVRVGPADAVLEWRERWCRRAIELLVSLGLEIRTEVASDPFFGRKGRFMASAQRQQQLKVEILASVNAGERTAIASSNLHLEHFGRVFDLRTSDEQLAHSGCTAFGEERIVLALLRTHGLDPRDWPREVRVNTGLTADRPLTGSA